jgi:hypothetical protein
LRWVFDRFQTDFAFNWLLATRPMRRAAGIVYFHRKGVFDAADDRVPSHDRGGAASRYRNAAPSD